MLQTRGSPSLSTISATTALQPKPSSLWVIPSPFPFCPITSTPWRSPRKRIAAVSRSCSICRCNRSRTRRLKRRNCTLVCRGPKTTCTGSARRAREGRGRGDRPPSPCNTPGSARSLASSRNARHPPGARLRTRPLIRLFPLLQRGLRFLCREKKMNGDGENPHCHKAENAAFGASRSSRQPVGAVQGSVRQVPLEDDAAVRYGVKECLAEVKTRVPSHSQPETAGAAQRKSENEPNHHHTQDSHAALPWITQVNASEEQ